MNTDRLQDIAISLLRELGEDPERPGLKDTPRRFANWWKDFLEYQPGEVDTIFESITSNQLVIVSGMKVWSLCEHHLLPFWCDVAIGYIPRESVLGLSKFARVAHKYAHQLQLQERLCFQIANEIQQLTSSPDVAVLTHGEHLCMTMRGIRTPGMMTSFDVRGVFEQDPVKRSEFIQLAQRRN